MILQSDRPFFDIAELRAIFVFALRHSRFPVLTPQLVLEDFLSIHPMLHVRPIYPDAKFVPLTYRFGRILCGRIKIVTGGGMLPFIAGGMAGVIQNLYFRCKMPGSLRLF